MNLSVRSSLPTPIKIKELSCFAFFRKLSIALLDTSRPSSINIMCEYELSGIVGKLFVNGICTMFSCSMPGFSLLTKTTKDSFLSFSHNALPISPFLSTIKIGRSYFFSVVNRAECDIDYYFNQSSFCCPGQG